MTLSEFYEKGMNIQYSNNTDQGIFARLLSKELK